MSPAQEIAFLLAIEGFGVVGAMSGWSISISGEPAEPATAITIYDTGGQAPETDEMDVLRPTFQVRVRGPKYSDAYEKQKAVRKFLTKHAPVVIATVQCIQFVMTSEIMSLGRDDNDRHVLTANYEAIRLDA